MGGKPRLDLTGCRFGQLTAVKDAGPGLYDGHRTWECLCDCGKSILVPVNNLRNRNTKSCGCVGPKKTAQRNRERSGEKHCRFKHGHALAGKITPTYKSWRKMIDRCLNPDNPKWTYYGGSGIKICARWLEFKNFLADLGERPENTTLGRYMDVGDYEPGNCEWQTMAEQVSEQKKKIEDSLSDMFW